MAIPDLEKGQAVVVRSGIFHFCLVKGFSGQTFFLTSGTKTHKRAHWRRCGALAVEDARSWAKFRGMKLRTTHVFPLPDELRDNSIW